jgi:hypothetical protein
MTSNPKKLNNPTFLNRLRGFLVSKRPEVVLSRLSKDERTIYEALLAAVKSHSPSHVPIVKKHTLRLAYKASVLDWSVALPLLDLPQFSFSQGILRWRRHQVADSKS